MADAPRQAASTRLDKWLWHARVVRTRTLAQKLVAAGKVRINRTKTASPSQPVKVGDVLTIALPRAVLVYEIAALADRRGSFSHARELYVDLGERQRSGGEASPGDPGPGPAPDQAAARRPDGRDRKTARRLRGKPE